MTLSLTTSPLLSIICLLGLHSTSLSHSVQGITQYEALREPDKVINVCGRRLAFMLSMVCNGKYNHMGKRDVLSEDVAATTTTLYQYRTEFNPESNPRSGFISDTNPRIRVTRSESQDPVLKIMKKGIYDECCRESCKMSDMYAYCGVK